MATDRAVPPLMMCGHAANAKDADGNPVCVICVGISEGARTVNENAPDLTGRTAKCGGVNGHAEVPSSFALAFFEYQGPGSRYATHYCKNCGCTEAAHATPHIKARCKEFVPREELGAPHDSYYCGCHGWD